MSRRTLLAALLLGTTAFAAGPLAGQPRAASPAAPRFGILAGLSSATFDFESTDTEFVADSPDRRRGFTGGVYLAVPLGTSGVALRPELLYTQKGATQRFSSVDEFGSLDLRGTTALSYLEAPVLVQYTVPTPGGLHPQFYAGPAFGLRTGCRYRYVAVVDGETQRGSGSCDDVTADGGFRRFDLGGTVGGALAFAVGGQALTAGVRYTHGFSNITTGVAAEDGSARNRAFAVYGSLELPVGRR